MRLIERLVFFFRGKFDRIILGSDDMIDVRLYENKDLEFVNNILRESFDVSRGNITNDYIEVVACYNDYVCGYLLLTRVFNPMVGGYYYLMDYVCVLSKYRNMGIGKKMVDYACDVCRNHDALYVQLTCSRFRVHAHRLYESCGFIKRDSDIYRRLF